MKSSTSHKKTTPVKINFVSKPGVSSTIRKTKQQKQSNDLPVQNVNKWLSEYNIRSTYVSLDKEIKKEILENLRKGKLTYGDIDSKLICPFLDISPTIQSYIKFIQPNENDINVDSFNIAKTHLKFLYDSVTENYYNQEVVKNSINSYIESYFNKEEGTIKVDSDDTIRIEIDDFDDFPKISISLYDELPIISTESVPSENLASGKGKGKSKENKMQLLHLVTINYPLYGLKSESKIWPVRTICGLSQDEYINFYSRFTIETAKVFAYLIYFNKLAEYVQYNPDLTPGLKETYGIYTIINLPQLARIMFPEIIKIDSIFDYLNRYIYPTTENVMVGLGAQCAVGEYLKTLKKKDRFLDENLINLIANTEVPLAFVTEIYDNLNKFPEKLQTIILNLPRVDNIFALLPDISIEAIFRALDVRVQFDITRQQQLINYYEIDPGGVHSVVGTEKITPENIITGNTFNNNNLTHQFFLSRRGLRLPDNLEQTGYPSVRQYCYLASTMQDYGFPTKTTKKPKPYSPRLLSYIKKDYNMVYPPNMAREIGKLLVITQFYLLTIEIIYLILKRGYINPVPFDESVIERHEIWINFNEQHKRFLMAGYNLQQIDVRNFCNMNRPNLELENLISDYNGNNLKEMMDDIGMVVPETVDRMDYFIGALPNYLTFLTRGEEFDPRLDENITTPHLPKFADTEIISIILDGYPAHISRQDLIQEAGRVLKGINKDIFVLLKPDEETSEEDKNNPIRKKQFYPEAFKPSNNKYNLSFAYVSGIKKCKFSITELSQFNQDIAQGEEEEEEESTEWIDQLYEELEDLKGDARKSKIKEIEARITETRLEKAREKEQRGRQATQTVEQSTINISLCEFEKAKGGYETIKLFPLPNPMLLRFARVIEHTDSYFKRIIREDISNGIFTETSFSKNALASKIFKSKSDTEAEFRDSSGNTINISNDIVIRPAKLTEVLKEMDEEDDYYIINESNEALTRILQRVSVINRRLRATNDRDRILVEAYILFSKEVQVMITDALVKSFDSGMLQRQWNGTNRQKYPMKREQTGTEAGYENLKEKIVGAKLEEIYKVINDLSNLAPKEANNKPVQNNTNPAYFVSHLQVMDRNSPTQDSSFSGQGYYDTNNALQPSILFKLITDMYSGNYCIRLGSSKMIFTAFYYLRLFERVDMLGNFNFWELDTIS